MAPDSMSVRLHLKRMRVTRVLVDEIDRLVVEVADSRSVVRCPFCGHKATRVHETRSVEVQDLPMGRPTTLVWRQRRFEPPWVDWRLCGAPRRRCATCRCPSATRSAGSH